VKALSAYISSGQLSSHLPSGLSLDLGKLFVGGGSAGGYLARLYALHASPKPKAFLSEFGMGGDYLSDHYVFPRPEDFGYTTPRPASLTVNALLHVPEGSPIPISVGSPVKLGPDGPYCDDGRGTLFSHIMKDATFLDYLTGQPGLTASLAKFSSSDLRAAALPDALRVLFPQFQVKELPPTVLLHGDGDTLVLLHESEATFVELQKAGIKSELVVVKDAEHGFRLASDLTLEAPGYLDAYEKGMVFLEGCL
jgi:acetyl esterase/lipase